MLVSRKQQLSQYFSFFFGISANRRLGSLEMTSEGIDNYVGFERYSIKAERPSSEKSFHRLKHNVINFQAVMN